MKECNVILQAGVYASAIKLSKPKHSIFGTTIIYNYFCCKLGCFQAFFGREKGTMKACPNCGSNEEVVAKFD